MILYLIHMQINIHKQYQNNTIFIILYLYNKFNNILNQRGHYKSLLYFTTLPKTMKKQQSNPIDNNQKNKQLQIFINSCQTSIANIELFDYGTTGHCLGHTCDHHKNKAIEIIQKYYNKYVNHQLVYKYVLLLDRLFFYRYPMPKSFVAMVTNSFKIVCQKQNKGAIQQLRASRKIWRHYLKDQVVDDIRQQVLNIAGMDLEDITNQQKEHIYHFCTKVLKLSFQQIGKIMKKRPPIQRVIVTPKKKKSQKSPIRDSSSNKNGKKKYKKFQQGEEFNGPEITPKSTKQKLNNEQKEKLLAKMPISRFKPFYQQQSKAQQEDVRQKLPIVKLQDSSQEQDSQQSKQLSQEQKLKLIEQQKKAAQIQQKQKKTKILYDKINNSFSNSCEDCGKFNSTQQKLNQHKLIHEQDRIKQFLENKKNQLKPKLHYRITKPKLSCATLPKIKKYFEYVQKVRYTQTNLTVQQSQKYNKICPYCEKQILKELSNDKYIYKKTVKAQFKINEDKKFSKQKNYIPFRFQLMHSECYIEINK